MYLKGFIVIPLEIKTIFDEKKQKFKKLTSYPLYKNIDTPQKGFNFIKENFSHFFNNRTTGKHIFNALAIKPSIINKKHLYIIDCDNSDDTKNGCIKFKDLLSKHNFTQKTVITQTPSGGLHYYFLADNEQYLRLCKDKKDRAIFIDGEQYDIDLRYKTNHLIFIPPSGYKGIKYKYINDIFTTKIADMPEWLVNVLEKKSVSNNKIKKLNEKLPLNPNEKTEAINTSNLTHSNYLLEVTKLLNILPKYCCDDYDTWIKIGYFMKNIDVNLFELYDAWAQKSPLYKNKEESVYKWNSFPFTCNYPLPNLKHTAKTENPVEYNELYKFIPEIPMFNSTKICREFLIDKNDEIELSINPTLPNKLLINNIIDWNNNPNIKALCLKSRYGSGKSQLIKKIIKHFGYKKILFISYRISLSKTLFFDFNELGFKSYLNSNEYQSDKFICQIDSLPKLVNCFHSYNINSYD